MMMRFLVAPAGTLTEMTPDYVILIKYLVVLRRRHDGI